MQNLTNSFIRLLLCNFTDGFLSRAGKLSSRLRQEIDFYLNDYEPLNQYEYE